MVLISSCDTNIGITVISSEASENKVYVTILKALKSEAETLKNMKNKEMPVGEGKSSDYTGI